MSVTDVAQNGAGATPTVPLPADNLLERERPDWAISTHFLPAEIIAWLRSKGRLTTRQAIVVTDFDVQGM